MACSRSWTIRSRTSVALVLAMLALMLSPAPEAVADTADCVKGPTAGYVFSPGEPQVLTVSCTGPLPTPYGPFEIDVRHALTDEPAAVVTTTLGGPGLAATAMVTPPLGAGSYRWNIAGSDPSESSTFGVASATPFISESCADGAAVLDGFLGDTYLRMRTHKPSPDIAWLCLRADGGDPGSRMGGRLEVSSSEPSVPLQVTVDVEPCGDPEPGVVPRPIPVSIGDPDHPTSGPAHTAVSADLRWADSNVTVCLEVVQETVGDFASSVLVEGLPGSAPLDVLRFVPDVMAENVTAREGWAGASAACRDATTNSARLIDATVLGSDLSLYTLQEANTTSVCVRADDGTDGAGGRLDVYAGSPEDLPPTLSPDASPPPIGDPESPCRWEAFTLAVVSAHYEDEPDGPALCVRGPSLALDLAVTPGTLDPPTVDWIED